MMPMRKIAEFYNIPIYSESNWFMSFGNSPYFSHYAGSAIDIYQGIRGFDGQLDAVSPIDGKIIDIIKIKPPIKKGYSKIDYIIVLNPFSNDNYYVRMLHIAPKVKVGESVEYNISVITSLAESFESVLASVEKVYRALETHTGIESAVSEFSEKALAVVESVAESSEIILGTDISVQELILRILRTLVEVADQFRTLVENCK